MYDRFTDAQAARTWTVLGTAAAGPPCVAEMSAAFQLLVGELFTAFRGIAMPTTVFIDASGTIIDTHTGALTRTQRSGRSNVFRRHGVVMVTRFGRELVTPPACNRLHT